MTYKNTNDIEKIINFIDVLKNKNNEFFNSHEGNVEILRYSHKMADETLSAVLNYAKFLKENKDKEILK